MRKAKLDKEVNRAVKKFKKDEYIKFMMGFTNRILHKIEEGKNHAEIIIELEQEQSEVVSEVQKKYSKLDMTEKFYEDIKLSRIELEELVRHAEIIHGNINERRGAENV
ncbi:MAG: hypothetical protein ACRCYT_05200 [Cetobacterium sp.]